MEKWLCWGSIGASALVLILFGLDLFLGIPFGRWKAYVDVLALIAAAIVLYLSWDALRDQR
jgi:hypothetical protein